MRVDMNCPKCGAENSLDWYDSEYYVSNNDDYHTQYCYCMECDTKFEEVYKAVEFREL